MQPDKSNSGWLLDALIAAGPTGPIVTPYGIVNPTPMQPTQPTGTSLEVLAPWL